MNPWPVEGFEPDEVHLPRPGHADLVGTQKYSHRDMRPVLERASARETAARVAAGTIARGFLTALGVSVHSHVLQIASVRAPERPDLGPDDFEASTTIRCAAWTRDERCDGRRDQRLRKANETLGGIFEVRAFGLVPGLGSHVSWDDRLDGRLAGAVPRSSRSRVSRSATPGRSPAGPAPMPTTRSSAREQRGYYRETNHAGGLEGGMTNGEPLSVRAAIKPISTMTKPLRSVDTATKEPAQALRERTDSCVVPAAGGRRRGDALPDPGHAATARSSAATTSTTSSQRDRRATRNASIGVMICMVDASRRSSSSVHGRRQVDRAGRGPRGRPGYGRRRRPDRSARRGADRRVLRDARRGGL